ncbi:MAG: 2-oxo acid dehydrogenase subunit E2 [Hyphomicrobium sp.]|uniref:dihydrolipoamide acetyltransferase family protein n=1 Tax=Hyphomicrobium sp. TaxID=82 RepID=UPI00132AE0DE|nr:dihydrolipoamide acetyltransferase family protein [Hyphomicrobium sp.]KAB2940199.1 MAG: 2-oxo acid dehydrogenase subunit E2 [Hyphomicrobium sp.]MBZ0208126.1 2-oxo acid dehydrogenase subunit E2 [Hyphomicrobium sp.]
MIEFRMPSLGADMEAGTLVEWLKKPGDVLNRGDIIAVVETQKGAIEIEVFNDGVLDQTLTDIGEKVPVGRVIATIRAKDEAPGLAPRAAVRDTAREMAAPKKAALVAGRQPEPAEARAAKVQITPAARRRAQQLGIDLAAVKPGPGGVVGIDQIEASRHVTKGRPGIAFDEMRSAIAAAMARSHREIPHYYVTSMIDVSRLMAWLEEENAIRSIPARLIYAVPLMRAAALALKRNSELNGHYEEGKFQPAEHINMGVAVAMRGGGLIAPAILEVETLAMDDLMEKLRDLITRVRSGRLRSSELSQGTVTFSNLGEETADTVLPLIYPPQVAIIGCGQIAERPWVDKGTLSVRRTLSVSVAGDHRVSDGRRAAQFLTHFQQLLHSPEKL